MLHYLCNCTRIQKSNKNLLIFRKSKKKKHNSFDFHEIETAWADIYAIFGRFLGDFGGDVLAI